MLLRLRLQAIPNRLSALPLPVGGTYCDPEVLHRARRGSTHECEGEATRLRPHASATALRTTRHISCIMN